MYAKAEPICRILQFHRLPAALDGRPWPRFEHEGILSVDHMLPLVGSSREASRNAKDVFGAARPHGKAR